MWINAGIVKWLKFLYSVIKQKLFLDLFHAFHLSTEQAQNYVKIVNAADTKECHMDTFYLSHL